MIVKNKCFRILTGINNIKFAYCGTYNKTKDLVNINGILYKLNREKEILEVL
jgi:hypothetical protein